MCGHPKVLQRGGDRLPHRQAYRSLAEMRSSSQAKLLPRFSSNARMGWRSWVEARTASTDISEAAVDPALAMSGSGCPDASLPLAASCPCIPSREMCASNLVRFASSHVVQNVFDAFAVVPTNFCGSHIWQRILGPLAPKIWGPSQLVTRRTSPQVVRPRRVVPHNTT